MNLKQALQRIAVVLAGAACMAPGCDGDVLKDSTFRLWCGETLCDWVLGSGSIRRVPTWHPNDYGVEFVDAPTEISQESNEGSDCMEFSAVADVDTQAQVKVEVDFNRDNKPDFEAPIAATSWHEAKILIRGPENMSSHLRFTVRKEGQGHAVLAELRLQRVLTCTGPRAELKDLRVGAGCGVDAQCQGGICCLGTCAQCCPPYSGKPDRACKDGVACKPPPSIASSAATSYYFESILPLMCGPGEKHGVPGDPCILAEDCASGACDDAVLRPTKATGNACGKTTCVDSVVAGHCR